MNPYDLTWMAGQIMRNLPWTLYKNKKAHSSHPILENLLALLTWEATRARGSAMSFSLWASVWSSRYRYRGSFPRRIPRKQAGIKLLYPRCDARCPVGPLLYLHHGAHQFYLPQTLEVLLLHRYVLSRLSYRNTLPPQLCDIWSVKGFREGAYFNWLSYLKVHI